MLEKEKNIEEQKYLENLVILGKKVSIEADKDKELEDRLKRYSSY